MVDIRIVTRQQPLETITQQSTDSSAHRHTVKLQPSAPLPSKSELSSLTPGEQSAEQLASANRQLQREGGRLA